MGLSALLCLEQGLASHGVLSWLGGAGAPELSAFAVRLPSPCGGLPAAPRGSLELTQDVLSAAARCDAQLKAAEGAWGSFSFGSIWVGSECTPTACVTGCPGRRHQTALGQPSSCPGPQSSRCPWRPLDVARGHSGRLVPRDVLSDVWGLIRAGVSASCPGCELAPLRSRGRREIPRPGPRVPLPRGPDRAASLGQAAERGRCRSVDRTEPSRQGPRVHPSALLSQQAPRRPR